MMIKWNGRRRKEETKLGRWRMKISRSREAEEDI
jgi:hypothetical protein